MAGKRRRPAAEDGVPPSLQIPPHTHTARSLACPLLTLSSSARSFSNGIFRSDGAPCVRPLLKESACEEGCESESNPKPRPQPKPSSVDVAERGVASIGVRSSGNLQGKEAALTHTNRHTGRASTVLRLGWLRCPAHSPAVDKLECEISFVPASVFKICQLTS